MGRTSQPAGPSVTTPRGLEAHTPGDYACLNLNVFTTELQGRESTAMPHRMFVTVSYEGDGSDQPDWKAATKSIELMQKYRRQDQPFFLAIGFIRPHYPSVAPVQYFDRYPHEKIELPFVPENHLDQIPAAGISRSTSAQSGIDRFPENQQRMWAAYYATVTFLDDQVGRVLDALERLGLCDTTAVVFTSDHGYHLGEHTFWQKASLREEVIRVPLDHLGAGLRARAFAFDRRAGGSVPDALRVDRHPRARKRSKAAAWSRC
jgi:iduronate 2-sulfatase